MITYEEYAKIRDEKGLTDGKIAKMCDFGRSTFTDWKSGRSKPKAEKMVKIAEALEMDYQDFVGPVGKYSSYRTYILDDELLSKIVEEEPHSNESMLKLYKAYMDAVPEVRDLVDRILKLPQSIVDLQKKQQKTDK